MKNIVLGTVQLGLEYGINNKTGKPSKSESFRILEYAFEHELRIWDTAAAYGNSEEVIGEFLKVNGVSNEVKIISKLTPNLIENCDKNGAGKVCEEIEKSLYRLGVDKLNGFLLHTPANFYSEYILNGLSLAKTKDLSENIGVSIYEMDDAVNVARTENIDYIQAPYNVLDQRIDQTDYRMIASKKTTFYRAPFLQGLLLMGLCDIPEYLSVSKKYLNKFKDIIDKYSMKEVEAALHFAFAANRDDFIVYGVETLEQLKEDAEIISNLDINEDFVSEVKHIFTNVEDGIVIPSLWAKK